MDGLNSNVITGKCSGCTAYRGKLEEARKKLCKTCGGSGKVWETGCEATEYLNWTACPDCDSGLLIQAREKLAAVKPLLRRLRTAHGDRYGVCRVCCVPWPCMDAVELDRILKGGD